MAGCVYSVNRGINKSIEFKGLKAQYIWWLGGGILLLMIVFALLYLLGVNTFICLGVIIAAASALFAIVYRVSNRYGEFGMMKKVASRQVPSHICCTSRRVFLDLRKTIIKRAS